MLVVYTGTCNVATSVWSSRWMSKHVPCYFDIFSPLVPSDSRGKSMNIDCFYKVCHHRACSIISWNIHLCNHAPQNSTYKITYVVSYIFKKDKTFSMLIYSYINTSGNWKHEKLCASTQFQVISSFTSVDITVYQHGKNIVLPILS